MLRVRQQPKTSREPDIENITVFADASFCHQTKAAGGAFWARAGEAKLSDAYAFQGAEQSHDSEMIAACRAILKIAEDPDFGKMLALGPKTRLVLVIDCLTVQRVLGQGAQTPLSAEAKALVVQVKALQKQLRFWLKVNHVKAHSGQGSPRQWVNSWCDKNARAQMQSMRDARAITN